MTLTPDRPQNHSSNGTGSRAGRGKSPKKPKTPDRRRCGAVPQSLFEQLEAAGMDLTGHQLADRLGAMDAVAAPDFTPVDVPSAQASAEPDPTSSEKSRKGYPRTDSSQEASSPTASRPQGSGGASGSTTDPSAGAAPARPCVSDMESPFQIAAAEGRDTSAPESPSSNFTKEQWADLRRIVPELTQSIESITGLEAELRDFRRPMGPDEAIAVMKGIEALSRVVDSLNAVTLSVFERVGTPKDYGAKSTKALVQNKLNLSSSEAHRRTELAKNLGNRVDMSGQSRPPKCPLVAKGLQSGRLSSSQASVIGRCLDDVPFWLGVEVRERIEAELVERAPTVRVSDLKRIFAELIDRVNPDGTPPTDSHDRSKYSVTVRERSDGDWDLAGLLDPVTGGIIQGWLTSRIKPDGDAGGAQKGRCEDSDRDDVGSGVTDSGVTDRTVRGSSDTGRRDAGSGVTDRAVSGCGDSSDRAGDDDREMVELFADVLSRDRYDAPVPAEPMPVDDGTAAYGWGTRVDGTAIDTSAAQGTVKTLMYERFATLIAHSEMDRVGKGAPFALVVTATAEALADRSGRAATGTEAHFPIDLAADEGLFGSVFFHLMTGKAKTMALATEQRHATRKQLALLASRDQGCTFPGCETPPGWCDAHHVYPWAWNGRTDINNLTLTCGMHHHLIDKSDWYAIMLTDGRPAWIPPASIDIERRPILHARFIVRDACATLFDDQPAPPMTAADVGVEPVRTMETGGGPIPTDGDDPIPTDGDDPIPTDGGARVAFEDSGGDRSRPRGSGLAAREGDGVNPPSADPNAGSRRRCDSDDEGLW